MMSRVLAANLSMGWKAATEIFSAGEARRNDELWTQVHAGPGPPLEQEVQIHFIHQDVRLHAAGQASDFAQLFHVNSEARPKWPFEPNHLRAQESGNCEQWFVRRLLDQHLVTLTQQAGTCQVVGHRATVVDERPVVIQVEIVTIQAMQRLREFL
ncbi:MAG: hypothetical protein M3Y27_08185 [Acidobacteriota bacterium]|nr:hypothetical protein [Acidobacteriota bacterium]